MTRSPTVAVIGAGPYGLSISAHLRARGITFRIFGSPMHSWRSEMPAGMLLKSEGFASNLYDPEARFTLERFCAENEIRYSDTGLPISLETMAAYGVAFQKQVVPELEDKQVVALDRSSHIFLLRLDDGELVAAQRVVVAVGCRYFRCIPPCLAHLAPEFLSHSSDHHDLSCFRGRDVTVIGGGASALDLAALLNEGGVKVRLVVRQPSIRFHSRSGVRSLWHRLRYPMSGIGPGWRSRFFTDAPWLFRYLPEETRERIIRTYLGPAGAAAMKDRIIGRVPVFLAQVPKSAERSGSRVELQFASRQHVDIKVSTDHIIAATGYRVDFGRVPFLSKGILSALRFFDNAPLLSANFQSTVPGLYFVGLASAHHFGPVMRFMFGANYTARRMAKHLGGLATR
jgi:Pyridine nucleotide-disulphide oxidoreductase